MFGADALCCKCLYLHVCVCVRSNFTDWIWPDRPDRLLLQGESMVNFKDYVLFFCPDIRLSSDVHRRPLLLLLYRWSNIILFLADITWHQHFLAISTCHCSPGRFPKSWGYPSHHSHHHPFGIGIFHNQTSHFCLFHLPSGKRTKNYGKTPFLMGKSTISMAFRCSPESGCCTHPNIPWNATFKKCHLESTIHWNNMFCVHRNFLCPKNILPGSSYMVFLGYCHPSHTGNPYNGEKKIHMKTYRWACRISGLV